MLAGKAAGLVIGRYTILDRIGSGAMGRVYRAQHQLMGRIVALKVIAPELISNERVVSRFLREMRLVARLDHPNVVRAFDADQVDNVFFIVMEYVPGKSLGDMLKLGPLPAVDVIRYASQAALGLGHAHEQGILHRDVKPSNLLFSQDQKIVKVLDLGLGALMEVDPEESFRTADGIAVGTIDYMSPEQASGKSLDGRSDLYSLACCMYHLMTGRCPFQHENPISRLAMRIQSKPTPIRDYLPDLPSRVVAVMEQMLATNPADRYQTGAEASEALQTLLRKKRKAGALDPLGQETDSGKGSGLAVASVEVELDQTLENSSESIDLGVPSPRMPETRAFASSAQRQSGIQLSNDDEQDNREELRPGSKPSGIKPLWVIFAVLGLAATFAIGVYVGRMIR
jgi:serine/threonine-protein kinase